MYLDILQKTGLSEKSAKTYLAALALGTATIKDIAAKAEMKRPTVYLHVEELIKDGLIEKFPSGKKEYFRAMSPDRLQKLAEDRLTSLKVIMPALEGLKSSIAGKPQVTVFEGREGIERLYRDVEKAVAICFWSDLSAVEQYFSQTFLRLAENIQAKKIPTREILPNTDAARKSSKRYAVTAGPTYSSRTSTNGLIVNDGVVFDDTVAFVRLHQQNFFAVVIKEPSIAMTMKSIFDMAWESATPFIGR